MKHSEIVGLLSDHIAKELASQKKEGCLDEVLIGNVNIYGVIVKWLLDNSELLNSLDLHQQILDISLEGNNVIAAALQYSLNNQDDFNRYLKEQGHSYLIDEIGVGELGKLAELRRLFNSINIL